MNLSVLSLQGNVRNAPAHLGEKAVAGRSSMKERERRSLPGVDKLRHSQECDVGGCDILVTPHLPSFGFFPVRQDMERQGGDAEQLLSQEKRYQSGGEKTPREVPVPTLQSV